MSAPKTVLDMGFLVWYTCVNKKEGAVALGMMKIRRNHFFQFMTILYFIIVFCMCITRFNIIMTLIGGPLTRIDAVNMIPFHSITENLKYGHSPVSWDMLYNLVMFVPFGIIYCYYQKTFSIYKAIGLSFLTTFSIEAAQFILKTGVVDIDDLIVNTIGSLLGIFLYIALQKILQWKQLWNVHEVIDTIATILPPLFISVVVEMFFGDGPSKLLFIHNIVLISYGIFDYTFLINDFSWKSKLFYAAFYVGIFWLLLAIL